MYTVIERTFFAATPSFVCVSIACSSERERSYSQRNKTRDCRVGDYLRLLVNAIFPSSFFIVVAFRRLELLPDGVMREGDNGLGTVLISGYSIYGKIKI